MGTRGMRRPVQNPGLPKFKWGKMHQKCYMCGKFPRPVGLILAKKFTYWPGSVLARLYTFRLFFNRTARQFSQFLCKHFEITIIGR